MPATRITVISGLAEGADRIFAEAALALNMSVEAVLPMPLKYYKKDFNDDSAAELDRILDTEAVQCIELPLTPGLDDDDNTWPEGARNMLYVSLSNDLRRRSNLLVAFWDGTFKNLAGGTDDTVVRYLAAVPGENDASVELTNADGALLKGEPLAYWIPIRRISSDKLASVVSGGSQPHWLASSGERFRQWPDLPDDFQQELTEFDRFNQQYLELSQSDSLTSYGNLLDGCADTLQEEAQQLKEGDQSYVMADSLALYFQARSDRLFKWFSLTTALMGLLFLVYAKLAAVQILLIAYLALFFGGVFIHRRGGKRQWFTRHLVYRCLAETMRVRFFLDLAGARDGANIHSLLETTGINKFHGFSWIRQVLQSTNPVADLSSTDTATVEDRIELARRLWIEDQAGYFERKTHQLHIHHQKLESIKKWVIGGLIAATVGLVFFKKFLLGIGLTDHLSLKTLLIFLMGLLPFWLGVWEVYQSKMAVKELMWQYRNQSDNYSSTNRMLQNSTNVEYQKSLIARLGQTSILENFLWIINRYHREHEPPVAG
jgi:translation initiation factor 2 beta subunit (eIF-2beta)/eIF-5